MRTRNLLAAILWLPMLTACAAQVYYDKPGATDAEFANTKLDCLGRANAAYPPNMQTTTIGNGWTSPTYTSCSGFGYGVSCHSTGGQYHPPAQMTLDYNQARRGQAFDLCMKANGWNTVDEDGNPVE